MTEKTDNADLLPELKDRWSPRAFSDKAVSGEHLQILFEAARWAPSSMNEQPWRFIYASKSEDPEAYDKLLKCLMEGNLIWAKHAPVLFVSVAKSDYEQSGKPNKHAWHDIGLATGNLLAQATGIGLHVHLMGGFHADQAKELLHIPAGFEPVAMGALGYLGSPDMLPEHLKERELAPRKRKPLKEIAFNGQWQG